MDINSFTLSIFGTIVSLRAYDTPIEEIIEDVKKVVEAFYNSR